MDQAQLPVVVLPQQELDDSLIEYYPIGDYRRIGLTDSSLLYYIKKNKLLDNSIDAADNFKGRVVDWITRCIAGYGRYVIITTVPRSAQGQLHGFLVDFCVTAVDGIANARYMPLLERTTTVEAAHEGGPRNQDIHEATIGILAERVIPPNPLILVLDDIWTTGSNLRACKNVLEGGIAGAEVKMLAIGRTQPCVAQPP